MSWLTININPPKLDVPILVRTSSILGYSATHSVVEFSSVIYDEDIATGELESSGFIEWMEIPE